MRRLSLIKVKDKYSYVPFINSCLITIVVGFGAEYFEASNEKSHEITRASMNGYKAILNSKTTEESLVSKTNIYTVAQVSNLFHQLMR